MSETYSFNKECKNCQKINRLTIPKGKTVKEFLSEGKNCFNCGCSLKEEEI